MSGERGSPAVSPIVQQSRFVARYDTEHRRSAIRFVTPDKRQPGDEVAVLTNRHRIYEAHAQFGASIDYFFAFGNGPA